MSSQEFDAQVRAMPGAAIIDLHGEINGFAEAKLSEVYDQAESLNPEMIILNFMSVHYINSTGIALIVGLLARARKAHRKLVVHSLSEHYREIFEITRLADYMTIYPDESSAIASIAV